MCNCCTTLDPLQYTYCHNCSAEGTFSAAIHFDPRGQRIQLCNDIVRRLQLSIQNIHTMAIHQQCIRANVRTTKSSSFLGVHPFLVSHHHLSSHLLLWDNINSILISCLTAHLVMTPGVKNIVLCYYSKTNDYSLTQFTEIFYMRFTTELSCHD